MSKVKVLFCLLVLIIVIFYGVNFINQKHEQVVLTSQQQSDGLKSCPSDLPSDPITYDWTFVRLQNTNNGVPYTRLLLDTGTKCEDGNIIHFKSDLGIHKGNCELLPTQDINLSKTGMSLRQVSRVQCTLKGSGEEVGLYKAEFEILAKVRDITVDGNTKPTLENSKDLDQFLVVESYEPLSTISIASSDNQAIKLVTSTYEIQSWITLLNEQKKKNPNTGNPTFTAHQIDDHTYEVHAFENQADHTATKGYYYVDIKTGRVSEVVN